MIPTNFLLLLRGVYVGITLGGGGGGGQVAFARVITKKNYIKICDITYRSERQI